jgi:cell division septation protein DedD
VAQDEYYYEIQLTNKQLVFYFMAGASGLVLSFLAGIMVGRGVDASPEVQAAPRPAIQDTIVEEAPPKAAPTTSLSYSENLESDRPNDTTLDRGAAKTNAPAASAVRTAEVKPPAPTAVLPPTTTRRGPEAAAPTTAPLAPAPAPIRTAPTATLAPDSSGAFTIQVGAFKERDAAESIVGKLKKKGFSAYVVTPKGAEGGLFNVRVGSFAARPEAEKVQERLRVEEKYLPFIVKQ